MRLMGQSQLSDNHWSIYLLVENNRSVRLNMAAESGYLTGNLNIRPYDYALTTSSIKHWDYKTVPGLSVSHIVGMIYQKGRHLYNMSGGGSGCRYWVYVILNDMAAMGWLEDGNHATSSLGSNLHFQYSRTGAQGALDIVYGEFVSE
ncbi:hypothetical protein CC80DRAFT_493202 [Byssothecium circinans]|uniref:DUF7770 domain-containing protein n=1 Tax=Byssothecium circinans TaxID=147558 RepID=A0A6A5TTE6_9PLEO|nr:hypothetical protein CC80DRAFT_493202 [Byssothecium circinans]